MWMFSDFMSMDITKWFNIEEYELKIQIRNIVENYELKKYEDVTWSGVKIEFNKFIIKLETNRDCSRLYGDNYIIFNWNIIYDWVKDEDEYYLMELIKILYKKQKAREKEEERISKINENNRKEEEKLKRQLLISEALASITWVELIKISKEVKDELSPIFDDVRRIQAITKEMEQIKKKYITI